MTTPYLDLEERFQLLRGVYPAKKLPVSPGESIQSLLSIARTTQDIPASRFLEWIDSIREHHGIVPNLVDRGSEALPQLGELSQLAQIHAGLTLGIEDLAAEGSAMRQQFAQTLPATVPHVESEKGFKPFVSRRIDLGGILAPDTESGLVFGGQIPDRETVVDPSRARPARDAPKPRTVAPLKRTKEVGQAATFMAGVGAPRQAGPYALPEHSYLEYFPFKQINEALDDTASRFSNVMGVLLDEWAKLDHWRLMTVKEMLESDRPLATLETMLALGPERVQGTIGQADPSELVVEKILGPRPTFAPDSPSADSVLRGSNLFAGALDTIIDLGTDPLMVATSAAGWAKGRGFVGKAIATTGKATEKGGELAKALALRNLPPGVFGNTRLAKSARGLQALQRADDILKLIPQNAEFHGKLRNAFGDNLARRGLKLERIGEEIGFSRKEFYGMVARNLRKYEGDPAKQQMVIEGMLDTIADMVRTMREPRRRAKQAKLSTFFQNWDSERAVEKIEPDAIARALKKLDEVTPPSITTEESEALADLILAMDPQLSRPTIRWQELSKARQQLTAAERRVQIATNTPAVIWQRKIERARRMLANQWPLGETASESKVTHQLVKQWAQLDEVETMVREGRFGDIPARIQKRWFPNGIPLSREQAQQALDRTRSRYRALYGQIHDEWRNDIVRQRWEAILPTLWGFDVDPYMPGRVADVIDKYAEKTGAPRRSVIQAIGNAKRQMFGSMALTLDHQTRARKGIMRLLRERPSLSPAQQVTHPLAWVYSTNEDEAMKGITRLVQNGGIEPIIVEPGSPRSKINYFVRWVERTKDGTFFRKEPFVSLREAQRRANRLVSQGVDARVRYGPGKLAEKRFNRTVIGAQADRRFINTRGAQAVELGLLDAAPYTRRFNKYTPRQYEWLNDMADTYALMLREESPTADDVARMMVRGRSEAGPSAERRLMRRADTTEVVFHFEDAQGKPQTVLWVDEKMTVPGARARGQTGNALQKIIAEDVDAIGKRARAAQKRIVREAEAKGWRPVMIGQEGVRRRQKISAHLPMSLRFTRAYGEIKHPVALSSKAVQDLNRLVHHGRFFRHISTAEGLSFPGTAEGLRAAHAKWGLKNTMLLPNHKVLGAMRGRAVHRSVWEEVHDLYHIPGLFQRFLKGWKYEKTVAAPVVWSRNFLSNIYFSSLAGNSILQPGNWQYYSSTAKGLLKNDDVHQMFVAMGGLEGTFPATDLKAFSRAYISSWNHKAPDVARVFSSVANRSAQGYAALDWFYKEAAFRKYLQQGMSPAEAFTEVTKWFPFYDKIPRYLKGSFKGPKEMRKLRDWGRYLVARDSPIGGPFVSFPAEALRIQLNAWAHKPLKATMWATMTSLLTTEGLLRSGRDPFNFQATIGALGMGSPLGDSPSDFPSPVTGFPLYVGKGKYGPKEVWLELGDILPYAMSVRQPMKGSVVGKYLPDGLVWNAAKSMIDPFVAASPVNQMISAYMGIDPATGRKMFTGKEEQGARLEALGEMTARIMLPEWAPRLDALGYRGGTLYRKIEDLAKGDVPDHAGRTQSMAVRAIRLSGLGAQEIDDRNRMAYFVSEFVRGGADDPEIQMPREWYDRKREFMESLRGKEAQEMTPEQFEKLAGFQDAMAWRESEFLENYPFESWKALENWMAQNPSAAIDVARGYIRSMSDMEERLELTATEGRSVATFSNMGTDLQMAVLFAADRAGIADAVLEPYLQVHFARLQNLSESKQKNQFLKAQKAFMEAGFDQRGWAEQWAWWSNKVRETFGLETEDETPAPGSYGEYVERLNARAAGPPP